LRIENDLPPRQPFRLPPLLPEGGDSYAICLSALALSSFRKEEYPRFKRGGGGRSLSFSIFNSGKGGDSFTLKRFCVAVSSFRKEEYPRFKRGGGGRSLLISIANFQLVTYHPVSLSGCQNLSQNAIYLLENRIFENFLG
jgi:hypothetical protein